MSARLVHALMVVGVACLQSGCVSSGRGGEERAGGYVYECRYSTQGPVVDGLLDDPEWSKAVVVNLVRTESGQPPRQPTAVRALWTDTHLYVSFDCVDTDIWASQSEHDGDIFNQEVVEVFIDDNRDQRSYVELEVSPNNTLLDMFVLKPAKERFQGMMDYELRGIQTAVRVEGQLASGPGMGPANDERWTVEIAIPFSQLVTAPRIPPNFGDRWRWNLYRIDRPGQGEGGDEYTAWSPTGIIDYHRPERFGELVFVR